MNILRIDTAPDADPAELVQLRTTLFVDERPVVDVVRDMLSINYAELLRSRDGDGAYFIFTCACGDAACAGIMHGVRVIHHPTTIHWIVRGYGPTQTSYFAPDQYRAAITKGLDQLKRLVQRYPHSATVPAYNRALVARG